MLYTSLSVLNSTCHAVDTHKFWLINNVERIWPEKITLYALYFSLKVSSVDS
jgi:hypothetical protein